MPESVLHFISSVPLAQPYGYMHATVHVYRMSTIFSALNWGDCSHVTRGYRCHLLSTIQELAFRTLMGSG
jgi:hypothetical protein